MAGVVFFFEEHEMDVYSGRRIDLAAWNYALKAAGDIKNVILVNRTKQVVKTFDAEINFKAVDRFPSLDGEVIYVICPWNKYEGVRHDLWTFDHHVDWYVFGPAHGWGGIMPKNSVTIPQSNDQCAIHAPHIATVVMMHRYSVIGGEKWRSQL